MIEMTVRTELTGQRSDNEYFITHVWADDYEDFTKRLDLAIHLIVDSTDYVVRNVFFPDDTEQGLFAYYVTFGEFKVGIRRKERICG